MAKDETPVRICEWSAVDDLDLSLEQRHNITEVVSAWQQVNGFSEPPLWFSGPEGETLNTRQYVGVVELPGIVIEIYPKLDKHLLEQAKVEVSDVDPLTALTGVLGHRWYRTTERFQPVFDLAKRLLQGVGHILSSADTSTFVFLLDMNKVFEGYVKALLEAYFNVGIEYQKHVGYLFPELSNGRIKQTADYFWHAKDRLWVGDAKYKHLAKSQTNSLSFEQIPEENADSSTSAGRILNSNDIRQLTVYAELKRIRDKAEHPPNILLLYPFVGDAEKSNFAVATTEAWNRSQFTICPVSMRKHDRLECALPANIASLDEGATEDGHK